MGACISKPGMEEGDGEVLVAPAEPCCKGDTTRARRLSVSADAKLVPGVPVNKDAGQAPAAAVAAAEPEGAKAAAGELPTDQEQVVRRNSGTRTRRLSYITNDNDIAARQAAGYDDGGEDEADAPPAPPRNGVLLSAACLSRAGREPGYKKTNQDSCFAFEKYISDDGALFGAMDGHGPHGHLVSSFVKQHLPVALVAHLTSGAAVTRALTGGFLEVDARLGSSRIDCEFSGSTCVVAYVKGRQLTTAWVGDSRCVLGRASPGGGWEALDLTADHKPTNPGERERITRAQGRVERLMDEFGEPLGPHRVWLPHAWVPGLAMSRALGDQLAHQVGVTSEPDHYLHELTPADKFVVLASDGVWEFVTSQEAVELVAGCADAEEACRVLVDEAHQRWMVEEDGVVDDITAVVVRFTHPDEPAPRRAGACASAGADGAQAPLQAPPSPALTSASSGRVRLRHGAIEEVLA